MEQKIEVLKKSFVRHKEQQKKHWWEMTQFVKKLGNGNKKPNYLALLYSYEYPNHISFKSSTWSMI